MTNRFARSVLLILTVLALRPSSLYAAKGPEAYLRKPDAWFASDEAKHIAENILSYQSDQGSWPKNIDTTARPFRSNRQELQGTFDNGATTGELRFLAKAFNATHDERYRRAFNNGVDSILKAQYANGGWPQFDPPGTGYHRYITFNDNAMVRLMELMRDVRSGPEFAFLDDARRTAAERAFDAGVGCILRCQVRVDGKLTAWCAQHDEQDFRPRPARAFELVSLSGSESVGIVRLLMGIDHPSPEIIRSIEAAVAWFQQVKLTGIREVVRNDERSPTGKNKVIVADPDAPALWARFYEIGTNRPLFADRDGVPRDNLADISYERRNGYAWYGTWPQRLLERDYPAWHKRWLATDASTGSAKVLSARVGDSNGSR